jgi:hypothetical protein
MTHSWPARVRHSTFPRSSSVGLNKATRSTQFLQEVSKKTNYVAPTAVLVHIGKCWKKKNSNLNFPSQIIYFLIKGRRSTPPYMATSRTCWLDWVHKLRACSCHAWRIGRGQLPWWSQLPPCMCKFSCCPRITFITYSLTKIFKDFF